ncbi:hypothetical protein [Oscillibacter sp.]|uniref:hypothetical protein n=1 Tax=Oscillibacter sp. TaxID=1945593 RepID=UPI00262802FE|nr:hypothetical protein [Oscillibacter sp.]MDD3346374.1 hypothetical protein [Oscillibacter sp.]
MKWINLTLAVLLLVLARKLLWCVRWLWRYYHGREVPPPIGWLPGRSGEGFAAHIQRTEE